MNAAKPVLILSESLDYHGIAVRWGLQQRGVPVDWWDRTEFPRNEQWSSRVGADGAQLHVSASDACLSPDRYRTIWNRRGQLPQANPALDRTDQVVARNESNYVVAGLAAMLADANPRALIANPFEAAKAANPKVHQLAVARSLGMRVPETLVSNHPAHIREFFRRHGGRIVAKQHIPFAWRTRQGALLVTGTSAVREEHLHDDFALAACPMIYQECLDVESELRIAAFGRTTFAMDQVRTQAPAPNGFVDIRYEHADKRAAELEPRLADWCRAYMDRMRLHYAAFDIARTRQGDYVFLEANEAGQFLFLEDQSPGLPMLDAFCQFLESGDPEFRFDAPSGLALADFEKSDDAAAFHVRYDAHMKGSELTSPFELVE
jgi:glutathione synthase/RimK-type ligase-like ATP-grasp enzyme